MREKRDKLYYVPGLITAIFLPIVFFFEAPQLKEKVVIRFFIPSDELNRNSQYFIFSSVKLQEEIKKKRVLEILLTEDHEQNEFKLVFLRHEARRLKCFRDTSTVLKVTFSNESTYEEVIDLLNILLADQHKRFALIGNSFYIYGEPPASL